MINSPVIHQPRSASSRQTALSPVEALKPAAWYRLDEFAGPRAVDSSGNKSDAIYEPAVTYYLEGPHSHRFCKSDSATITS